MTLTNGQQTALYYARKQRRDRSVRVVMIGLLTVATTANNGAPVAALKMVPALPDFTFTLTGTAGGAFELDTDGNSIVVADKTKLVAGPMLVTAEATDGTDTYTVGASILVT